MYSKRQTKIINGEIPIEDAYQQELVKLINKAAFIGETEIYEKYKKIFEDRIMMREAEKRRKPAPYMSKEEADALELKGDRTTGWSTGWRVNLYARLHDAKNAYHIYRKLLSYVSPDGYKGPNARRGGGTYPNLLDAHSPFQIDGNFGGCAGVVEMLMQSRYSIDRKGRPVLAIELLPALPSVWKDGHFKGLCTRGNKVVECTWKDGEVTYYAITEHKR